MSRDRGSDLPVGPVQPLTDRTRQILQLDLLDEQPDLAALTPLERVRGWCFDTLEDKGKISGLVAAARVADAFRAMDRVERDAFYSMLERHFSVELPDVEAAIDAFRAADGARGAELARLTRVLESPRLQLFRQFSAVPEGLKFLVDLRADIGARVKELPELWAMERELRHLLESWFSMGFLRLERITWQSPAALLEKLVEYEAVHAIGSWQELKRRLQADRACYAFLHQSMPTEPVIFVEVALVRGLAGKIQELLDTNSHALDPQHADTAIFYSITNAQRGLRGIPFGNLLIKQVTPLLRAELPNLTTFATLSPIPRLREEFFDFAVEDGSLEGFFEQEESHGLCRLVGATSVAAAVEQALARDGWVNDADLADALRPGLLRAARAYLTEQQRRGRVACPVGHFHASNGAKLGRINWLGDTSAQGLTQSAGMMVNYIYEVDLFEHYQTEYTRTGRMPVDEAVQLL